MKTVRVVFRDDTYWRGTLEVSGRGNSLETTIGITFVSKECQAPEREYADLIGSEPFSDLIAALQTRLVEVEALEGKRDGRTRERLP